MVRPHRATIYRRVSTLTSERMQVTRWEAVATDVPCDIQPTSGQVDQEAYGRRSAQRVHAFFDTGTDLRPDDGVGVTAGPGPRRWLVKSAGDWGPPGDLEADLEETKERFDE